MSLVVAKDAYQEIYDLTRAGDGKLLFVYPSSVYQMDGHYRYSRGFVGEIRPQNTPWVHKQSFNRPLEPTTDSPLSTFLWLSRSESKHSTPETLGNSSVASGSTFVLPQERSPYAPSWLQNGAGVTQSRRGEPAFLCSISTSIKSVYLSLCLSTRRLRHACS